jgi:hypothetical protein
MRLMHTKLTEFIEKMHNAAKHGKYEKPVTIRGLENLKSAKMQSLRTGRIEDAVTDLTAMDDIASVDVVVVPRVPETMHTVLIKGKDKDGKTEKIILEVINILHPTEEAEFDGCTNIVDHRPKIGLH